MTLEDNAKPVRKAPRWMKITLVVSLALNLLVFGAIGSRVAFGPQHHGQRSLGSPGMMLVEGRRMLRKLPPERRKALRGIVRSHRGELRTHRQAIAKARAQMALQLDAGKLDVDALKAAMLRVRKAESNGYETVERLREEFILALTPEERRKFSKRLLRHYSRYKKPNHRPWWRFQP